MFRIYGLIICLFMVYSCKSAQIEATPEQVQIQKEFAETTTFTITSSWVNPMPTTSMNAINNSGLLMPGNSAGRIDISQTLNHLIMEGTTVDVDLPYFGERQIGGGYNTDKDSGMSFKGEVKKLAVNYNEKKKVYTITFNMNKGTESMSVTIDLFENLKTRININSSHRTSISYDGVAKASTEPLAEN